MIPNEKRVKTIDTTHGERVDMTIDEHSLLHIMSVLTDLYSDTELACIREYSTNAFDSHIEAGIKRPIEVTTPTALQPMFVVRDYGVGMDAEDIRRVYSKYGASTKRDTNDLSGVLGLGSKSALTYTPQFTVKGVKDGVRILVSVSRSESGAGVMKIIEESKTDEENGVEITIPAAPNNRFRDKAAKFFQFWDKGTVILDGVEPKPVYDGKDILDLGDDIYLAKTDEYNPKHVIVMGNVAYPMPLQMREMLGESAFIIKRVDIGTVDFTPNREELQETNRTKAAVADIGHKVKASLRSIITNELESAATPNEALQVWSDKIQRKFNWRWLNEQAHETPFTYKGKPLPLSNGRFWFEVGGAPLWRARLRNVEMESKIRKLGPNEFMSSYIVHGFPFQRLTKKHVLKIRVYAEKHKLWEDDGSTYGGESAWFLVSEKPLGCEHWLKPGAILDWEKIRVMKEDTKTAETIKKKAEPTYKCISKDTNSYSRWRDMSVAELEKVPKDKLFWTNGYYGVDARVFDFLKGAVFVKLPSNRQKKFEKLFPHAKREKHAFQYVAENFTLKMPQAEFEQYALTDHIVQKNYSHAQFIQILNVVFAKKKTDDPDINELATTLTRSRPEEYTDARDMLRWLKNNGFSANMKFEVDKAKAATLEKKIERLRRTYPLLEGRGMHDKAALATYVNAVYHYNTTKEEI